MKIAVAGCSGRMGLMLVKTVSAAEGCSLVMGSERAGFPEAEVRKKLASVGAADLTLTSDAGELVAAADAVIDFTTPSLTAELAKLCAKHGTILISGTTGLSDSEMKALEEAAAKTPIVSAGNMSLGVNVLSAIVEKVASMLGEEYDIEIDEMHHRMKKDSPSGTAIMLGKAAAAGRGVDFEKKKVHYGEGILGEREAGTIGLSARRGGDVVGVHTVTFAGPGENLELTHRGFSRDIYANGAVKAALWAKGKKPGLYSMRDVLGL